MMNKYGARRSPLRTPVLILTFVVSPTGISTTEMFFIHYLYGFDDLLWDAIRMKNPEQFIYVYRVKGFLEVDDNNGSFFLVVSHFLDDARICEDVDRRGLNPFWFWCKIAQCFFLWYWYDTRDPQFRWSIP